MSHQFTPLTMSDDEGSGFVSASGSDSDDNDRDNDSDEEDDGDADLGFSNDFHNITVGPFQEWVG